jgi:hypothetical protein
MVRVDRALGWPFSSAFGERIGDVDHILILASIGFAAQVLKFISEV